MPKYYRPSSLRKHCARIVTLLYHTYNGNGMISILTRDMHTSLVAVGENVQSSEYVYDHMGRLMTGSIEFVGKTGNKYDVSTSYNKAGGLESKVSSPDASAQVFAATSQEMTYDLTYQYSGTKPHQLSEVISSQGVPYAMSFSYNASGSISEITDLVGVDHSSYYWGQEQWLCGVENTQGIHHYVYDHAGERVMKSSITQTTVQLNDETINTVTTLEPYTLYVNPYYVVTSFSNADQRSKHYYMGTQRVATDIGVDYGVSPSPEQFSGARSGDDAATAGETTQGLETDQSPTQSLGYEKDLERVLLGLSGEIGVEDLSEALVPIERFYPDLSNPVNSGEGIESELPLYIGTRIMYWYHPDYVSNVDMVTDRSGEAYELFLYNAWGESLHHWTSSSTNSWSSPYRLNSKELDSETGMHYYGARYHHPKLSVWMSVDPLAHLRTWVSPYNFVQNNPILRIDPDGRLDDDYTAKKDGSIEVKKTDDNFDRFFVENNDGSTTQVAQLDKVTAADGKTTLVKFPESGNGFTRYGDEEAGGDRYVQPTVAASLFGAINEFSQNNSGATIQLGNMSAADGGKPGVGVHTGGGTSHVNGRNVDARLIRTDRALSAVTVFSPHFDRGASQSMVNSFNKFGFKSILSYPTKDGFLLNNTKNIDDRIYNNPTHHNHLHLQGYSPKLINR